MNDRTRQTRRSFLLTAAGGAVAGPLVGRSFARAAAASETLNVASVGVGGMGWGDLGSVASAQSVQIVALCDVDAKNLAKASERFSGAQTFRDYRRLLDAVADDIDAVIVSTPDHMHGSVALAALQLGKHVYCQKPLAHNLRECRAMQTAAAENERLVTQMGTQIHSEAAYRTGVAMLRSGAIGKVREIHLWVGSNYAGPPGGRPERSDPVPDYLNWDLWLGVAPETPFVNELYHPFRWRQWVDFGTGALGDMGCHLFDPIFSALELKPPTKVTSHGPRVGTESFVADNDIRYTFAGTARTDGEIACRWTDGTGSSQPDAQRAQLPDGVGLPGGGSFLVGEKGVMVLPHWDMPRFYAQGQPMDVAIEEVPSVNHYHEWADACRGEGMASTPFGYGCPITETVLAGTVAERFPGRELAWDSGRLSFDDDGANLLVSRMYRDGWEIAALEGA